jgi:hypothetical protein
MIVVDTRAKTVIHYRFARRGEIMPRTKRPTVAQLKARANRHHADVLAKLRGAIHHANESGKALIALKPLVGRHGNWTPWLEENFDGSPETARGYVRIARHWDDEIAPRLAAGEDLTLTKGLAILRVRPEREPVEWPPPWLRDLGDDELFYHKLVDDRRAALRRRLAQLANDLDDNLVLLLGQESRILFDTLGDCWGALTTLCAPLAAVFGPAHARYELGFRRLLAERLPDDERERRDAELWAAYQLAIRPLLDDPRLGPLADQLLGVLLEKPPSPPPSDGPRMRIYYSGCESRATPEAVLGENANVMPSFYEMGEAEGSRSGQRARFRRIAEARRPAGDEEE